MTSQIEYSEGNSDPEIFRLEKDSDPEIRESWLFVSGNMPRRVVGKFLGEFWIAGSEVFWKEPAKPESDLGFVEVWKSGSGAYYVRYCSWRKGQYWSVVISGIAWADFEGLLPMGSAAEGVLKNWVFAGEAQKGDF